MDSLRVTDDAAKAVQQTPNRVALADIEAAIAREYFIRGSDAANIASSVDPQGGDPASLDVLTICILVMRNGFTVIGKSAPADAGNFDAATGARFAREDAIRQLWPLMGYALRDRLYAEGAAANMNNPGVAP